MFWPHLSYKSLNNLIDHLEAQHYANAGYEIFNFGGTTRYAKNFPKYLGMFIPSR